MGSNSRVNLDRNKEKVTKRLDALKAKLVESGVEAANHNRHVGVRQLLAELRGLNDRLKTIDKLDAQNAKRLKEKADKAKAAAAPKEEPKKSKGKGKGKGKPAGKGKAKAKAKAKPKAEAAEK